MLRIGVLALASLFVSLCAEARADTNPATGSASAASAAAGTAVSGPTEGPASAAVMAVATPATEDGDDDDDAGADPASDKLNSTDEAQPDAGKPKAEAAPRPPEPTVHVSINLTEQRMSVSENGGHRYTWAISSGTARHPTPTGVFRPEWTSKMWYSRQYDWAPMPHAVFINGGVAVHGTYHVSALGRPASHGCIRLSPANAKTFYNLVQRHGLKKVKVTVFGKPNWRSAPGVASRGSARKRSYASGDGQSWFWGSGNGERRTKKVQRHRPQPGKTYYYADGTPAKVYRNRNGDLVFAPRDRRRRPAKTYGFGYGY